MAKKRRKNKLGIIIFCLLVFLFLAIVLYLYLNSEDNDTSLSIFEKQWVENNKSKLIDVEVVNNIDIYSKEGTGVVFDFIDDFKNNTGLQFNLISYTYPNKPASDNVKIMLLDSNEKAQKNDINIANINYLLIGHYNEKINSINQLYSTVGILENDNSLLNDYLKENSKISVKTFSSIDALINAYKNKNINNMIVPNYLYLSNLNDLSDMYINYQINDVYKMLIIRMGNDKKLNNIINKYYLNWVNNNRLYESYNNQLFDYYTLKASILDRVKKELSMRTYKYGYIENVPYNLVKGNKLYGIAGEYINMLSNMDNIEFEYIKYNTTEALIKALNSGDVDIAFVNFSYSEGNDYFRTDNHFIEEVVGLSKKHYYISSLKSLKNYNLYTYQKNYIYENLNEKYKGVKVINKLNEKINDNILILDKEQYLFYATSTFKDYKMLFEDSINNQYSFLVDQKHSLLYNVLNFTINYSNNEETNIKGLSEIESALNNYNSFNYIIRIILLVVFLPIILFVIFINLNKKIKENKLVKKEDVLKYTDMLTSLKNRNYLNNNMKVWGEMNVFPRTIVIVDLNNLKYVNDNYGYESGNQLIMKAASVLINTQLEKSEIVRSDGNEFLIYLLGYSEKQINTYVNKLQKELDKLPYGFGAAIGYSTISDEIKTIDDAINEATIEMRSNKEQIYNNINNKE